MNVKTGTREPDGYCSIHGASFINVYDERNVVFDCMVCANIERLEKKISQLKAAFEDLATICQERLTRGETSISLEAVRKYAEQNTW